MVAVHVASTARGLISSLGHQRFAGAAGIFHSLHLKWNICGSQMPRPANYAFKKTLKSMEKSLACCEKSAQKQCVQYK